MCIGDICATKILLLIRSLNSVKAYEVVTSHETEEMGVRCIVQLCYSRTKQKVFNLETYKRLIYDTMSLYELKRNQLIQL